jgi:hypothetical protein
MKLTVRGQGVVAGLLLAVIVILAHINNGGEYKMEGGQPVEIEQPEWSWEDDVETVGDEFIETGIAGGAELQDEAPMCLMQCDPPTNPCPWELAQAGECEF